MVFFEAPHRLAAALAAMAEAFGADRPAAVCRELTKTYEEVRRAGLARAGRVGGRRRARRDHGRRGRCAVAGRGGTPADLVAEVEALVRQRRTPQGGHRAAVAAAHGVSRREVYDAVLAARRPTPGPD